MTPPCRISDPFDYPISSPLPLEKPIRSSSWPRQLARAPLCSPLSFRPWGPIACVADSPLLSRSEAPTDRPCRLHFLFGLPALSHCSSGSRQEAVRSGGCRVERGRRRKEAAAGGLRYPGEGVQALGRSYAAPTSTFPARRDGLGPPPRCKRRPCSLAQGWAGAAQRTVSTQRDGGVHAR